jgi:hypothetical protein
MNLSVAGPAAEALFGIGLLRQAPLFLGLFTAQILIGEAVVLVPGNLITLIINTQVLEGAITR